MVHWIGQNPLQLLLLINPIPTYTIPQCDANYRVTYNHMLLFCLAITLGCCSNHVHYVYSFYRKPRVSITTYFVNILHITRCISEVFFNPIFKASKSVFSKSLLLFGVFFSRYCCSSFDFQVLISLSIIRLPFRSKYDRTSSARHGCCCI